MTKARTWVLNGPQRITTMPIGIRNKNWDTVMEMKQQRYHTAITHRTNTLRPTSVTPLNTPENRVQEWRLVALRRDDGAVVYLNEVEIMRSNA